MEAERNMRLAYAIINNLNIIDGDLFIDNADSEKAHDEFVKNLNRKSKNF